MSGCSRMNDAKLSYSSESCGDDIDASSKDGGNPLDDDSSSPSAVRSPPPVRRAEAARCFSNAMSTNIRDDATELSMRTTEGEEEGDGDGDEDAVEDGIFASGEVDLRDGCVTWKLEMP